MRLLFLIFLLCFSSLGFSQITNPIEKQISDEVMANATVDLALLEKLVNINSGTTHLKGIQEVGKILQTELNNLGFSTEWVESPLNMQRAGTLVAKRTGSQGKHILLIGHLDTVFPKESHFQHFHRKGHFATGPGVIDEKGGDVVILGALKALHKVHALDNVNITVVFTGDEEDAGKPTEIARKPLIDAAQTADVALDFEWSISLDTATIARRGISSWTIETEGNSAHSSEIFGKAGFGVNFELARILEAIRTQLSSEKYLTLNPGIILGGTDIRYNQDSSEGNVYGKKNVIAKTALAKGDIRFLTQEQQKKAQDKILEIAKHNLPGTSAMVYFQNSIPAMPPTTNNLALLKKYSKVSQDLGGKEIKPLDPGLRGAGDISHIANIVPANLSGLGPLGTDAHSDKETLDIRSLPIATQRAALLIYRLTR